MLMVLRQCRPSSGQLMALTVARRVNGTASRTSWQYDDRRLEFSQSLNRGAKLDHRHRTATRSRSRNHIRSCRPTRPGLRIYGPPRNPDPMTRGTRFGSAWMHGHRASRDQKPLARTAGAHPPSYGAPISRHPGSAFRRWAGTEIVGPSGQVLGGLARTLDPTQSADRPSRERVVAAPTAPRFPRVPTRGAVTPTRKPSLHAHPPKAP